MDTHISQVLVDFGKALGLEELKLDEDDHCCLKFDDLAVHVQAAEDTADVLLYSAIATLKDSSAEVMRYLLAANYATLGTSGSTIGVHPDTGEVLLYRRFSSKGLEVLGLESLLEVFISTAEQFQSYLNAQSDAPAVGESTFQMPMHTMIRG